MGGREGKVKGGREVGIWVGGTKERREREVGRMEGKRSREERWGGGEWLHVHEQSSI